MYPLSYKRSVYTHTHIREPRFLYILNPQLKEFLGIWNRKPSKLFHQHLIPSIIIDISKKSSDLLNF